MKIIPRELVILADDYKAMVRWYQDILQFKVVRQFEGEYHYCNLETESGIKIGIAPASEVGVEPNERKNNTLVLQIEVDDVTEFFDYLKSNGVELTFGPSFDKNDDFWYGCFTDLEGNQIWVVDKNCP